MPHSVTLARLTPQSRLALTWNDRPCGPLWKPCSFWSRCLRGLHQKGFAEGPVSLSPGLPLPSASLRVWLSFPQPSENECSEQRLGQAEAAGAAHKRALHRAGGGGNKSGLKSSPHSAGQAIPAVTGVHAPGGRLAQKPCGDQEWPMVRESQAEGYGRGHQRHWRASPILKERANR